MRTQCDIKRLLWRLSCYWIVPLAACLCVLTAHASPPPMRYIYPAPESAGDVRFADLIVLMKGALERTTDEYGPYIMVPAPHSMTEARQLSSLQSGGTAQGDLTVVWSSTSEEKEHTLLPIRIPLRKGLLGYRISFIEASRQAEFDRVKTLDDLRRLIIGQGIGWGDIQVYHANKIQVKTGEYKDLFPMVTAGRFDLFPRGISEIFDEYQQHHVLNPNMAIEKNLLIYYPWPYYFFFNRYNVYAAGRLEKGLWMMIKDGSFDQIFKQYNAKAIEQAGLSHRRIINW